MLASELKYYLKNVVCNAHKWQKVNINDKNGIDNIETKFYKFSFFQYLFIFSAILICLFTESPLNANIVSFIINVFAILIGLLTALLIIIFDKFGDIVLPSKTDIEIAYHKKVIRYFQQFNTLTTYSILIAICVIISLALSYILDVFMLKISISDIINYVNMSINDGINVKFVLGASVINLYRIVILYFILDFFYILTYSISSIYSYFNSVYSDKLKSFENE